MPQIFSPGWLFLFLLIMAVCVVRIFMKVRDIHARSDMGKPVLPVAPVKRDPLFPGGEEEPAGALAEADRLIKEGLFGEAVALLTPMLSDLSPVEDREMMGKIQYRLGACQRRIGAGESDTPSLLRSGEALREAVNLFSPERLHRFQIRASSELAGLYEDLAGRQNPIENFTLAWKTWEAAAVAAKGIGLPDDEANFRARAGSAVRRLASHDDRKGNLQKAVDIFEKALAVPGAFEKPDSLFRRAVILKMLGDVRVELSKLMKRVHDLTQAVSAYDDALDIMDPEKHPQERSAVLVDSGRILLDIYDAERSPAHLRKALRNLKEAVNIQRSGDDRARTALSMALLGDALVRYAAVKDQGENLDRAARFYETALGFLKGTEYSSHRERIRIRLKKTMEKRGGGGT
jgi:tetratricopeptide (TPR) repeat protein